MSGTLLAIGGLGFFLLGMVVMTGASRLWAALGGIDVLCEGMAGLEGVVTPPRLPGDTIGGRALLVLIGVAITLVTQSSSAGVAAALTAVHAGAQAREEISPHLEQPTVD